MKKLMLVAAVAATLMVSGCAPEPTHIGTGTLVSADGLTTGNVEVSITQVTDDFGVTAPLASVKFSDLDFPYSHITAGGALEPRGDDPCFDTGFRSSGGMLTPDANGSASTVMPAEAEGFFLYEVVLHLDWTQIDDEVEACMQPVVARAVLEWAD